MVFQNNTRATLYPPIGPICTRRCIFYLILDSSSEFQDRGHIFLVRRCLLPATLAIQHECLERALCYTALNANYSSHRLVELPDNTNVTQISQHNANYGAARKWRESVVLIFIAIKPIILLYPSISGLISIPCAVEN